MKKLILLISGLLLCLNGCSSKKAVVSSGTANMKLVAVKTSAELKNVLQIAKPGDSIVLADGEYSGRFVIPETARGTSDKPIVLTGSRKAMLNGGNINSGYILHLKSDYWKIKGITITNGLKGIMLDNANHNYIDNVLVTQIGEEAIHLRKFSSDNTIQNSEITYAGLYRAGYGEGIYIGSAYSNWQKYTNGESDKCDNNKILNNKIGPYIAAECIDIKEGTTGGLIKGNIFNSQGIKGENSADSWIDVKGNNYLIEENKGYNSQPSVLKDGYQVNCAYQGWGCYNEFRNNVCEVNATGHGFNIRLKSSKGEALGNKVYTNNIVNNAKSGITNITLSN